MSFPFMVVIRVCFPSQTNFPLKVSRYTSRCCVNFYLHYQHIIYSRMHRHPRFAVVGLFSGVTFRASCNMFMSIRLHVRPGVEILGWKVNAPKRLRSFNKTNFGNSL